MKIGLIHITFSFLLFWTLTGCESNYISSIPNYPVNLELNLTVSYPTFKDIPNQFLLFDKPRYGHYDAIGFGGILVICGIGSTGDLPTEYYAFDLACPYEAKANIKVIPNSEGDAICEECGSKYDILFGTGFPKDGLSKEPLKRYKTTLINSPAGEILRITNR